MKYQLLIEFNDVNNRFTHAVQAANWLRNVLNSVAQLLPGNVFITEIRVHHSEIKLERIRNKSRQKSFTV